MDGLLQENQEKIPFNEWIPKRVSEESLNTVRIKCLVLTTYRPDIEVERMKSCAKLQKRGYLGGVGSEVLHCDFQTVL